MRSPQLTPASCAGRTPSKEVAPAGRTEETDNNKFKSCRSVSTQSSVERACSLEKHIIRFSGDGWKQVKCEGGTGIAFEREAHSSQKLSSDVSLMCDLYVCGVRLTTASFERKCCNSIGFHQCD
uniref:Uncharacterized protein TCIL3000_9_630 n=1 Tax=Trypanosoma congolense (strain IL3000) TaxID=1068625 RepID=G0UTF5_TRYCI|nr:unnamed protein product [Trypanosoma congolense IL3000]